MRFVAVALVWLLLSSIVISGASDTEEEEKEKPKPYKPKEVDPEVEDPDHGTEGLAQVTEEEYHSKVPPKYMRCDACAATAFWIHRSLKLAHKEKFLKKMKEYDVIDVIDDVCLPKTYSRTYGIKNINGKHRLSGGGLKAFYHPVGATGTAMPGQWLNYQCRATQGEFGEDELYDLFWKYHVVKGHEQSDIPFFRKVCIERLKLCTEQQALETYDGLEEKHLKEKL